MAWFCKRCGWTVRQVFEHSREELELLAKHMSQDENDYLRFQAAIHGIDPNKIQFEDYSERSLQDNLKRLQRLGMLEVEERG